MRINELTTISGMLLMLTVLFVFNTSFAGWELLQNSPTTNDLHSVFFIDENTGWIAGYNNSIFKTTNSGENWVQQTSPEASNFECITFVNVNTGWVCGSGGTVIKTTNGGTNWFSQTFTSSKFNSMDFIDANTGYIAGDFGNIRKTINGGINWISQVSGISQTLHQIKFVNSITGFAVGSNAYILRTTNAGLDWIIKSGPGIGSQIFYTIRLDSLSIYNLMLLATGTLTKYSYDYGENLILADFPVEAIYSVDGVLFSQNDRHYYGVGSNGYIVKTTNYGGNWMQQQSPTSQDLFSTCYADSSNFNWAVGAGGTILKFIPDWFSLNRFEISNWDLCFINQNTGWKTSLQTVSKTTNSGYNWIEQVIPTQAQMFSITFINDNTGWEVGDNNNIIKTTNGGNNWFILNSGLSGNPYWWSVDFFDNNIGWICGYAGIMKTTDGGNLWTIVDTNSFLYELKFINANTGWAMGINGKILKTTNGGMNWYGQNSGTNFRLSSFYMIDANTGWAAGNDFNPDTAIILKTTNGGTNWQLQNAFTQFNIFKLSFLDANLGYITGQSKILKTTNGGNNWIQEELLIKNSPNGMQFVVNNNLAVGFVSGRPFLRTSFEYIGGEPIGNSGNYPGWVQVNSGTTGYITAVDYINPFVAFGVGGDPGGPEQGLILRTINGGQTWIRQQSNELTSSFNDVSFADVNNGIAVGGISAVIRKTTNGGLNWTQQTSVPSYGLNSVDMLDVNNAFACGMFGLMIRTTNGGLNWQTQITGIPGGSWNGINYINLNTATAVGLSGKIIRTTNAGLNWVAQTGGRNLSLMKVKFIDVNNGIIISSDGPVFRTTNGGTNWLQTDSLSGYASSISYSDANNVFIVTQFGGVSRIYRSINGGLNWSLQDTREANISGVSFTDLNNGIITGTEGLILRTSNAGIISGINTFNNKNNLNLPINDFQSTADSININLSNNPNLYAVTRVYLKVDTVLHTNDSDLEFFLEHNGITDTIVYRNGGSGDNFFGTFLNDATNFPLVSGTAPFRGSFKPYKPFSKFNGQNPNGYWKLRIYDRASGNTGTLEAWSLNLTYQVISGIAGYNELPLKFQLSQNYPNPFNPVTKIKFSIPSVAGKDLPVKLKIYDILGREIVTLINQQMRPGSYIVEWNASNFASGVYFYRLETSSFVETKKMVLVK